MTHENYQPLPRNFYGMHWALYGVLSLLTLGIFSLWVSFRLTEQVAQAEADPRQKKMLYFTWLLGTLNFAVMIAGFAIYGEDGPAIDAFWFTPVLVLLGRFAWTFALRKSLFQYYAREHQRLFLPNGFFLLFIPVMLTLAKLNYISQAEKTTYSDTSVNSYANMTCLHPALYCLINILTLCMYQFFVMGDMTAACRSTSPEEKTKINHLWITLKVNLGLTVAYICLVDLDADITQFDRIASLVLCALTLTWAYKIRRFILDQIAQQYTFKMTINPFLLFFFPGTVLLCAARHAPHAYALHEMTRHTAAK